MSNNILLGLSKIRVGKLTKRDVVVSPPVTKHLWHYIEIGQSQSIGVKTDPYHSESGNTNSRVKMLGATPVLEYINGNADLVGDEATLNGQLLNICAEGFYDYASIGSDQFVESGSVLFGRQLLSYLDTYYANTLSNVVVTKSGRGSQSLDKLDKNGSSGCFERAMYAISRVKELAESQGFIYHIVAGVRHGGTVNDDYDLDVAEIINNLKVDILALTGLSPTIFFEQTRQLATVTPEASEAMARIVGQTSGVYITNPRYATEYGGDNIHQTTDGQIHSMLYMARAIKNVVLDGNDNWSPFFAGDPIFSEPNGVPTITMSLFGIDGAIEGSGDYAINIYNETLAQWVSRNDYTVSIVNDSIVIEFSTIGAGETLNVWTNYEDVVPPFNSFKNNFADDVALGYLRTVYTGPPALFLPDDSSPIAPYDPLEEYPLDKYLLRKKYTVQTTNTIPALQDIIIPNTARSTIRIQTDRVLDATSLTDVGQFTLGGTIAVAKTITGRSVDGADFVLTVDSDFEEADAPTITYVVPGSNPIKDTFGNTLAAFTDYTINNTIAGNTPSTFVDYSGFEELDGPYVGGYYGFSGWPFTSRDVYVPSWKEYHPVGFDEGTRYWCIIDIHGTGFKSRAVGALNEGAARWINLGNEIESPQGDKFIVLCPAGGEWMNSLQCCNMIEYAFNHPNVNPLKIFIGGLSGGAMSSLRLIGENTFTDVSGTYNTEQHVQKLAGIYSLAGSMFTGYDPNIARNAGMPILAHHGALDGTRSASNIAALRKTVGNTVIYNCFQGIGHSGSLWDRIWYDGNSGTALENGIIVDGNPVPSDAYKGLYQFCIDNSNSSTVPAVIDNLSGAGVGTSQIDLTWTNGYDGGEIVNEIELQRSLETPTNWQTIASVGGGQLTLSTESYDDTGLSEATSYKYRIRRINSIGPTDPNDGWSPEIIVATQSSGSFGTLFVNLGATTIQSYNLCERYTSSIADLIGSSGANTGVGFVSHVGNAHGTNYTSGEEATDGFGSKLLADAAAQEFFRMDVGEEFIYQFTNLDPAKLYKIIFYSSWVSSDGRDTLVSVWKNAIDDKTGVLTQAIDSSNAYNEEEYCAVFDDFAPSANNDFFISAQVDVANGTFGAANAIVLIEK